MRPLLLLLPLLLLPAACAQDYQNPLSYGRCTSAELCGLETRCERIAASTSGAPAFVCTQPCAVDRDCPGFGAVCRPGLAVAVVVDGGAVDGGTSGRCLRTCAADGDCRPGTVCRGLTADAGADLVCVANLTM
ncbi:MAG: hypothetical protein JWM10_1582 [Myxococcaceae bacterium]|nr:hypothetical protein [Myxococcaceae bacterium]